MWLFRFCACEGVGVEFEKVATKGVADGLKKSCVDGGTVENVVTR